MTVSTTMTDLPDTVDTSRYQVERLNATNYFLWSRKIELVLRGKGLWGFISGDEDEPTTETEKAKYLRRKDMALSNLLLTIEDACSASVIDLREPKAVWEELKTIYQAVSTASVDSFLTQYQGMKMCPKEKVVEYVNRLTQLENKLSGVGHAVSAEEKTRALLRGLTPNFKVPAQVIRALGHDRNVAVGMLVTHEMTTDSSIESEPTESTALSVSINKEKKCFHCGRKGHLKSECFHNPESPMYKPNTSQHRSKSGKKKFVRGKDRKMASTERKISNGHHTGNGYVTFIAQCLASHPEKLETVKKSWFIDSGATSHMTNDKSFFPDLKILANMPSVSVGNGDSAAVHGTGTVEAVIKFDDNVRPVKMMDTLFIPDLMCNLVSVSKLRRAGFRVLFDTDEQGRGLCVVQQRDNNEVVLKGWERKDGLFEMDIKSYARCAQYSTKVLAMKGQLKQDTWHARLGHASKTTIEKTIPIVNGIDVAHCRQLSVCTPCLKAKSKRDSRPSSDDHGFRPLELVHSDVIGPVQVPSLGGSRYCVPLYDDGSALSLVRFVTAKYEVPSALKEMIAELETVSKAKVERLRTDNGSEFKSKSVQAWLKSKGIKHELTSPYSPESNGKAERLNRTLMDIARSLLQEIYTVSGHERLWAEAMHTANYIRNRMYTSACNDPNKTPFEVITGKRPDLSHLRKFGATAYVHIPKEKRKNKFATRATVGILVGFDRGNSYKVYLPESGTVITSRDVIFDELQNYETSKFYGKSEKDKTVVPHDLETIPGFDIHDEVRDPLQDGYIQGQTPEIIDSTDKGDAPLTSKNTHANPASISDGINISGEDNLTHYPNMTRYGRISNPPDRYTDVSGIVLSVRLGNEDTKVPTTYREAVSGPNSAEWLAAMQEEIDEITRNGTWVLEPRPAFVKPVKSKWVYANKFDSNQHLSRRRARLVAKGFTQQHGIDYNETFAPVAKYSTIRFLLALATDEDLNLLQIDVKSAFLNGNLAEAIFLEQPEGFVDPSRPTHVYRLHKALYGLKQASRAWHCVVDSLLKSLGFKQSDSDCSLYIENSSAPPIYIIVYVDDMLLASKSNERLQLTASRIGKKVSIRIESEVTKFLGILICRDWKKGTLHIHSRNIIDQLLEKFGMRNCNPVYVPIPPGMILDSPPSEDPDEGEGRKVQFIPYRELVGSFLHLANTTRPDIAFVSSFLSRFMQEPRFVHWKAAKHVLRYLKGTKDTGISFNRRHDRKQAQLVGYTDSDFAADRIERKSVSGYVFIFAGGAISWRSKKQELVAQSTVEAEYVSMAYAVRETIWLRRMLADLKQLKTKIDKTTLYGDNQGALAIARNDISNERSKHIDVKYHFLKQHVKEGTVDLTYIHTTEMVADIMTKSLVSTKHKYFSKKMGCNPILMTRGSVTDY